MSRFPAMIALAIGLGVCAVTASAQTVVGKSAVDGRVIELLSDQTWRFADTSAAPTGCQELPLSLAFCGKSAGWTEVDPPSPEIAAQYHYNDRHYGQYVIEGIGSDDGVGAAFFRKVVIGNAATAAGIREEDVVILGIEADELEGKAAETIVYQLAIDGLDVVFANTIVVMPKKSLQAMTFAIGKALSGEHQALHREFLGHTRIK